MRGQAARSTFSVCFSTYFGTVETVPYTDERRADSPPIFPPVPLATFGFGVGGRDALEAGRAAPLFRGAMTAPVHVYGRTAALSGHESAGRRPSTSSNLKRRGRAAMTGLG